MGLPVEVELHLGRLRAEIETRVKLLQQKVKDEVQTARSSQAELVERTRGVLANRALVANSTNWGIGSRAGWDWDDVRWSGSADGYDATRPLQVKLGSLEVPFRSSQHSDAEMVGLPAFVPVFGAGNVLFHGSGVDLAACRQAAQLAAIRLVACTSAGSVRLTLIDPVGLGQNFNRLLRLDEYVRGPMAWHEPAHIQDALVELTSHMSMVIQKYLTDRYPDIEAYNRQVGVVTEPYRVLLVSDFPAGFDRRSAERLLSIAQNGPRVGVYTILSWDHNQDENLPRGWDDAGLTSTGTNFLATNGTLRYQNEPLAKGTLKLDAIPSTEFLEGLVTRVNKEAKVNSRVVVPLSRVLAGMSRWSGDSAAGLEAPLGVRGNEVQQISLGQGTSNHVLLGGTTGSGKSVLLHVLITSLCHLYSPDQLELYLIDFKEGVEFRPYVALPHVHVLALQSEREFGISVLEGLVSEVEKRAERFKQAGVTKLSDFRRMQPGVRSPRVLLIVDEFQIFFSRNDSLGSRASELLDLLVRQGRSYGVHVLLASQTLAGVDLDSGTLSQLAVRIAMRMSEADSYKVLSKDNGAARFLEHPGEGIYNEKAGLPGGNVKFQTAYLATEELAERIQEISATQEPYEGPGHRTVFDGSATANLLTNRDFVEATQGAPPELRYIPLFLGEPVAVKQEHVHFKLRRQSRSNLLMCGQDETAAASITVTALLSFLTYGVPKGGRAIVLNLSNVDGPGFEIVEAVHDMSPDIQVLGRRDVVQVMDRMDRELAERSEASAAGARKFSPLLLSVFGIQGARELVQERNRPTKELSVLLRCILEGPDLGIHVQVWANTNTRLGDSFETRTLQEFDTRVALRGGDGVRVLTLPAGAPEIRQNCALVQEQEIAGATVKIRTYGGNLPEIYRKLLKEG